MAACQLCHAAALEPLLNHGPQPVCSHYRARPGGREQRVPLGLALCRRCGLLQLRRWATPAALAPRHAWLAYREPEGHLDRLAATLARTCRLTPASSICGISYKDASTLRRLERRGFTRTWTLRPREDLAIASPRAGLETLQARFSPARARAIAAVRGRADLVIARHILEHAQDLHGFAAAMRELIKPGGAVAFEVPDFSTARDRFDYATIWEEHIAYFTPATLRSAVAALGFGLRAALDYPYPLEHSLVAIADFQPDSPWQPPARATLDAEVKKARTYAGQFGPRRARLAARLARARRELGPIALFGAGHLAVKFVNLLGIGDLLAFVADDDPHKQGLFMPGSRLPILPSPALRERGIRLCLLALSPESEDRVIRNQRAFAEGGGRFASVFPASPRALKF